MNRLKEQARIPARIAFISGMVGALLATILVATGEIEVFVLGLVIICAGAVAASLWRMWTLAQRAEYRITQRYAALGWIVALALALGTFVLTSWALGTILQRVEVSGGRAIGLIGLAVAMWAAVGVLTVYRRWTVLFVGNANGLTIKRDKQFAKSWNQVAHVVIAPGADSVEIAIVPVKGASVESMPVRTGEVLTEFPVRVTVPAAKLDLNRLKWVLNQSGCTDIALIERTPAGQRRLGYANRWHDNPAPQN